MGNRQNNIQPVGNEFLLPNEDFHQNRDLIQNEDHDSQLVPTATLKPSVHIRKESIKYDQGLSFIYDSFGEVTFNFYFFAIESVKSFGNTECYYIDLERHPNPVIHEAQGGLNHEFPNHLVNIDLTQYTLPDLSFADKKMYPLIIEIRPKENQRIIEVTYCKFKLEGVHYKVKVIKQKLTMDDKSYEINEIYGIRTGNEEECVVCLTNPKDTIVLPCRHHCLCLGCANIVRGQNNSKCPICRIAVESLLNIKIDRVS
ncbi:hypothetical protein SteCoe_6793 [Stentor coeruleus]|uniref:RING-type domain-containing protein n=1 Tax=Stentor coeruleus TaxID=5963 RepID=A0A1R2CP82_9CILI|nr:hypothetical protein SteCoe_6793 [Stentor coeruleus]